MAKRTKKRAAVRKTSRARTTKGTRGRKTATRKTRAVRGTRKGTRRTTTRKTTRRTTTRRTTPTTVTPPTTVPTTPSPWTEPTTTPETTSPPSGGGVTPSGSVSTSHLEFALREIEASVADAGKPEALEKAVEILSQVPHYTWVGVYLLDGDELVLGPWRGPEATEHTRIRIGEGICGLAARTAKTVNVADVNEDPRYLACFASTRSELVVPIFDRDGGVAGEIDIDSDTRGAFTQADESVIERVARLLTPFFDEREVAKKWAGVN